MKYHWPEALASVFIVGLGQIVKGESKKGILLLLVFYFSLPALIYISLLTTDTIFYIVFSLSVISGIIIWIYSIGEALLKDEKNI